jgi:4-amino-4-deoxy-L-arabinose transferase-like glycosyltransferase
MSNSDELRSLKRRLKCSWQRCIGENLRIHEGASGHLRLNLLLIMSLVYILPGLAGYGPWKPDEPYMFGMIHSLMQTGDWVVPTLAGEPFMEKPPLLLWVSASTAKLSSPWLPTEHGARLAIGVFMFVALLSTASAARQWWGKGQGRYAALALIASLGLLQHGRMMIADVPLFSGFALACCGWAWLTSHPVRGGLLLGTGAGIGFMAKGLLGPGVLVMTAIALPLVFKRWRKVFYVRAMGAAILACLPWLLIWPVALYLRSPDLFVDWFWVNNVGRFLGFSVPTLGASHERGHLLETLPWFTFPVLPLAAWTWWKMRHTAGESPALQVCGLLFVVMIAVLSISASGRVVYLLPLLVPLSIAAVPAMSALPRLVAIYADWTARVISIVLIALLWTIWLTMLWQGAPPFWPLLAKHLPMDFVMQPNYVNMLGAVGLLAGWVLIAIQLRHVNARAVLSVAVGLVVTWGTTFLLLLPWIDAAKSYQATFRELSAAIPADASCVASTGLGESERGILHFVAGILPRRTEIGRGTYCDVMVWQGLTNQGPYQLRSQGWSIRWEGTRPGENRERFWLLTRDTAAGRSSIASSR